MSYVAAFNFHLGSFIHGTDIIDIPIDLILFSTSKFQQIGEQGGEQYQCGKELP
jgi:hypothetical protein